MKLWKKYLYLSPIRYFLSEYYFLPFIFENVDYLNLETGMETWYEVTLNPFIKWTLKQASAKLY